MFRFYKSGIIASKLCGTNTDHIVLIVGFGNAEPASHETKKEYWIVMNVYGPFWGDHGYMYIAIEDGPGICGINQYPSQPYF